MKCLVEAVKADRLARAGDIAVTFERPAMVDAAAKFAKAMKKSNLAERILMLAEDEDDEEDSSDDEDDEDSSDEDDEKDDKHFPRAGKSNCEYGHLLSMKLR